jgi:pantoate kinase
MASRISEAYAPAAISNFFAIHDEELHKHNFTDFSRVGATGGGFTLSKGVYTRATLFNGSGSRRVRIRVNGDPNYPATTTRRALELLINSLDVNFSVLEIDQRVEVPIGYGFGASAASALSAVLAASSVLEVSERKERIAYFAHASDIICQTGLGTVSSIYDQSGAGVILRAGAPGVAKVKRIKIPGDLKVITALLAPYKKSDLLSSDKMRERVCRLGSAALADVLKEPTIDTLLQSGEKFAAQLGLETDEIKQIIRICKENRARGASQNMLGYVVHAVANDVDVAEIVGALKSSPAKPLVQVFDIGRKSATLMGPGPVAYPRTKEQL